MDIGFLFRGLIIGFSIAAPVGPIGVLCIRRTLAGGRAVGFVSGLGAALADACYGCIAALGLTTLSNFLVGQQTWLRLIGGAFLCYLGSKTFIAKRAGQTAPVSASGLAGALTSTFVLTLTNPMTILSFAAVFAGLGLGNNASDSLTAATLVLGVFGGSACWWLLLSSSVGLFREKFSAEHLRWVNRVSGAVIAGFGLLALVSLWK